MKTRLEQASQVLQICQDCGLDVAVMKERTAALAKLMGHIEAGFLENPTDGKK